MAKEELVKQALKNLQFSTMSSKEKAMWTILLPSMPDKQIKELNKALEEEAEQLMALYFQGKEK